MRSCDCTTLLSHKLTINITFVMYQSLYSTSIIVKFFVSLDLLKEHKLLGATTLNLSAAHSGEPYVLESSPPLPNIRGPCVQTIKPFTVSIYGFSGQQISIISLTSNRLSFYIKKT